MMSFQIPYDFWYQMFLWSTVSTLVFLSLAIIYICLRWRTLLLRYFPTSGLSGWKSKTVFERVRDLNQLPITLQQIASKGIARKQRQYLQFEFGCKIHKSLWVIPTLMLMHIFSLYALLASSVQNTDILSSVTNPLILAQTFFSSLLENYGLSLLGLAFSFSLAAYILVRLLREASKYAEHYGDWMHLMNEVRTHNQGPEEGWLKRAS